MPIQAISGNINPYAAEATVFNTQPFVQYAMQQEAKKQAAQDAIDAHLAKNMAIDYSKMREQDKADFANNFNKDVVEWAKANRDALRDRGAKGIEARLTLAQKMEGKKAEIGSSIQQNDEDKKVDEYVAKLKAAGIEPDEQTIAVMANRGLSMYNNKFYKNPMTKETYGVKDLQNIYKEHNPDAWIKDITAGKVMNDEGRIGGTGRNIGNFETEYKTRKAYSDKDYMDILNNAAMSYEGSPSTKRYFDNQFHKLADAPTINNAFKQVTGRDIQNGKDAAIATAMASVQKEIIGKEKVKDDFAEYKAKESYKGEQEKKEKTSLIMSLSKIGSGKDTFDYTRALDVRLPNGKVVKDLTGTFGGNIKTGSFENPDGTITNSYLKSVTIDPITKTKYITFNNAAEARKLTGAPLPDLKDEGAVTITYKQGENDKSYSQLMGNLGVVNGGSKEETRKKIVGLSYPQNTPTKPKQQLSVQEKEMLDWVNDPANKNHKNYNKFKSYLQNKGY
jgi:hypothetical protein